MIMSGESVKRVWKEYREIVGEISKRVWGKLGKSVWREWGYIGVWGKMSGECGDNFVPFIT